LACLTSISIHDFRNLSVSDCALSPRFNLLTGDNGAGKTSVLEAIYFLGSARSFRTANVTDLIAQGSACATVRASVLDHSATHTLGIERGRSHLRLRRDQADVARVSTFIEHVPVLALHPHSDELIVGAPDVRRKFLDRAAFYLYPEFFTLYGQFARVLKQRNAALRNRESTDPWDDLFIHHSALITDKRQETVAHLRRVAPGILSRLNDRLTVDFDYAVGVKGSQDLREELLRQRAREYELGTTLSGPHRGDLVFTLAEQSAKSTASRGQIKLMTVLMILSVSQLWQELRDKSAVLLFDDMFSEFDRQHVDALLGLLSTLNQQCVFSATPLNRLDFDFDARFAVQGGQVGSMV
jgi:DNA replication and repair protein RecF